MLDAIAERIAATETGRVPEIMDLFEIVCATLAPARLNELLRCVGDDLQIDMSRLTKHSISLFARPEFSIDISMVTHQPACLYWHPRHTWYHLVGGRAAVTVFHVPDSAENAFVDADTALEKRSSFALEEGNSFVRDGRTEVIDIASASTRPLVLLRLHAAPVGGIEWMFSRDTRRPLSATSVDPRDSHLINLIYSVSRFKDRGSLPPLTEALAHPRHFVRWAAVQAIGRIDREAALSALSAALHDDHPHLRAGARKALAQIERQPVGSEAAHGADA